MLMQPRSGTLNNPSTTINTESTWLLVRGLYRQQRHWEAFPSQLALQLNSQVLCCDIAGTGLQWQATTPISITGIMRRLRNAFRQQHPHVSYPIRLLGISMGGMICSEWAKHFPNEIQRMVFINTSFKQFSPLYQRLKPYNITTLIKILCSSPLAQEQAILTMTSHTQHRQLHSHQMLAQRWCEYAQQQPVSRNNALRQLYAASRFSQPVNAPIESILLLASTRDQLVDVRCSTAIAKKWQCPIHYHPTAGHDLPLDDGNWVCQKIADWLTE
ncbi:alpha/beta fold hydrolase [Moritella sp. Urea-trap-13]|uniref:alpha/beta fold hydrolase n=1 Tax=Moritella sp. Urea-trap-13 TaxID=2058327 RepID=UPI000C348EF6|nr:alpha/beta hydrolase [Moritella sp. Urea-trap-13]PKH05401.1 alpha/beta hydrolase [Moritella sp. Urea-trap-13]